MGVYIEGLKMPKNVPLKIWLLQDGNARIQTNSGKLVHFKAVEVKAPHGDLIDRSKLAHDIEFVTSDETCPLHIAAEIDQYIAQTPTVLEAEGKDDASNT